MFYEAAQHFQGSSLRFRRQRHAPDTGILRNMIIKGLAQILFSTYFFDKPILQHWPTKARRIVGIARAFTRHGR